MREPPSVWTFANALAVALYVWVFAILMIAAAKAQGQDHRDPAPHARYHDYYKEWKQPVAPNADGYIPSCCSPNTYADFGGKRVHIGGDCEPTIAELRKDGHWWAKLPQHHIDNGYGDERGYVKIPHEKIVRETNPEPDAAHLCWVTWAPQVLCFVPPFGGM